jgi:lantibiotic leader peptide-processing serine protease
MGVASRYALPFKELHVRFGPILCAIGALSATTAVDVAAAGSPALGGHARTYVVVFDSGASTRQATRSIQAAGGTVERVNSAVGVATVRSTNADFAADAAARPGIEGAAANRSIGRAPRESRTRPEREQIERLDAARQASRGEQPTVPAAPVTGDPLASLQWDMQMIHATADGSYREQQGSRDVRVGIMDTGVDASHPDIAPNFDFALSRNFTVDDPIIDGACDTDPDGSCTDPATVDEDGHGTHVAGTIGAALNGIGIAGVAPKVDLVNLRAGQDSGIFFIQPFVDALTYAADHGIDVVNMSFYIDPWLYNCAANPADSPDEQAQQRAIIAATQRAVDYARARGVAIIAAAGNEHTDLGNPTSDPGSPDYPPNSSHPRTVDNRCLAMPTEADGVVAVSSVGPSGRKAYYSNYGTEQTDVAAPGGDFLDFPSTDRYKTPGNLILAPYPEAVGRAAGDIDADGNPTSPFVVKDTEHGQTAYYQYLQGTSMATPHAVGVAALIVSQYGTPDARNGGLTLPAAETGRLLQRTATHTACPQPRLYVYDSPDLTSAYNAYCMGGPWRNGFYGDGVVDALSAIHALGGR